MNIRNTYGRDIVHIEIFAPVSIRHNFDSRRRSGAGRASRAPEICGAPYAASGRWISTVVPFPGALSTWMKPPARSTSACTIASPSPVPVCGLVVK